MGDTNDIRDTDEKIEAMNEKDNIENKENSEEKDNRENDANRGTSVKYNITINMDSVSQINYATARSHPDFIHNITISNNGTDDIVGASLSICAESNFFDKIMVDVPYLPAGGEQFVITNLHPRINCRQLAEITEAVTEHIVVSLDKATDHIADFGKEILLLAFDMWQGSSHAPELICSFVTPNHPAITKIIQRAGTYLASWTGSSSFNGYLTDDPNDVLKQSAAIYSALCDEHICYVYCKPSFETVGQRVRLADEVLSGKIANCLDATLLYSACLEAVGLRPLVVFKYDHAFAGVWLEKESLSDTVERDPTAITKRMASGTNKIAVIEATDFLGENPSSFDDARSDAEAHFTKQKEIECTIDVNRARMGGVRPLPQRVMGADGYIVTEKEAETNPREIPTELSSAPANANEGEVQIPKIELWKRKLLDLSMRNSLINFTMGGRTIPLVASSLSELSNKVAGGSDFHVMARPSEMDELPLDTTFEQIASLKSYSDLVSEDLRGRKMRSYLKQDVLDKRLKALVREAKVAIEESGANVIYMALGLLRWYEVEQSKRARYAPIIMVPVDIVRNGRGQGYSVRVRDDEPFVNVTILEKLKQDYQLTIDGLDPIPTDANGNVNVMDILNKVRAGIMTMKDWDVIEVACLGKFFFSQFVMWNDLCNRTDDLMRNPIVRSLIEGQLTYDAEPMRIEDNVTEEGVLLPMPADATQLFAIKEAAKGKSFVLHGPPGTGKSQTITSLIANALADGKSVLFVAEKMAALSVVRDRLEKIGIGPFCLELHSNKTKKKDFIERLTKVRDLPRTIVDTNNMDVYTKYCETRAELNRYVEALHRKLPSGYSIYELCSELEKLESYPDVKAFTKDFVRGLSDADHRENISILSQLASITRIVGNPKVHPLRFVKYANKYSVDFNEVTKETIKRYFHSTNKLLADSVELYDKFEGVLTLKDFNIDKAKLFDRPENILMIDSFASEISKWENYPTKWLKISDWASVVKHTSAAYDLARTISEKRDILSDVFSDKFIAQVKLCKARTEEWASDYTSVQELSFIKKAIAKSKLMRKVKPYLVKKIDFEYLGTMLETLKEYIDAYVGLMQVDGEIIEINEDEIIEWLNKSQQNYIYFEKLLGEVRQAKESYDNLAKIPYGVETMRKFARDKSATEALKRFSCDKCQFDADFKEFYSIICPSDGVQTDFDSATFGENIASNTNEAKYETLLDERRKCKDFTDNEDKLKEWVLFNSVCKKACDHGLSDIVALCLDGEAPESLVPIYQKAVYKTMCRIGIDESETLCEFSGALFNEQVNLFRELDAKFNEISAIEIRNKLIERIPSFDHTDKNSDVSKLNRYITSKGRGKSIRSLIDQIPDLITKLCPCMLMSPLSASQYLNPERSLFDIVVFDEASQLPTSKAVGAIARGKSTVIVGDPKQMPPTMFFKSNIVDEENFEYDDLESILDDCITLGLPETELSWHYRSKHESLIAFSNNQFYDNKLLTFPSVSERESRVRFTRVKGTYDRTTNTNQAEAEAIAREVIARFKDPDKQGQSIGIVTFNEAQQTLIEDLLEAKADKDTALYKWLYESEEPIFVKNLENVQGDERDVILFSIGYAPDQAGKFYLNFGPLNREGGFRRLNVAVTRARSEMQVFSSISAIDIDYSRTHADGMMALHEFLDYAEHGILRHQIGAHKGTIETKGIAESIARALETKGYKTDIDVGHSDYKIDLAVIDPRDDRQYMLGILLDGASYRSARTAHDREIAQVDILKSLGWNVIRVWTMDWWDNKNREMNRIYETLFQAESL